MSCLYQVGIRVLVFGAVFLIAADAHAARKIFIGELSVQVTSAQVLEAVSDFGEVLEVKIASDTTAGSARAEVTFADDAAAARAVVSLDGFPCWDGSNLRVRLRDDLVAPGAPAATLGRRGLTAGEGLEEALSEVAHSMLDSAFERAKQNDRAELMKSDLPCLRVPRKKPPEVVVVGSKVKEAAESAGFRASDDFVDYVNRLVVSRLREAGVRARDNKRGTVRPYDL